MTQWQKTVKYAAMVLAVILTVSIIGGIVSALTSVFYAFGGSDAVGELTQYEVEGEIRKLDIDLGGASLTVKNGESFSVESDLRNLSVKDSNGTLSVKQNSVSFGINYSSGAVTVTIPEGTVFDTVKISAGAGKVGIDTLSAKTLNLDFGAGQVDIKSLTATDSADIDGGAGQITVSGGELHKLDLDMGIGEFNLCSRLSGRNALDMGVGEANITLIGAEDDYTVDIEKGLGDARINGSSVGSGSHGDGNTYVEIDGGIGAINISFESK